MSMSLKVVIRLTFDRKMVHIKCGFPANNVCRSLSKRFWVSGGYVAPISIIEEVYDAFNNSEDDLSITYSRAFRDALCNAKMGGIIFRMEAIDEQNELPLLHNLCSARKL